MTGAPETTTPYRRAPLHRQPRRLEAGPGARDPGEASREQAIEQPAPTDARPLVGVTVGEPADRERDRPLLEHGGAARGVRRAGQCDEASPSDAARLDRDDEPVTRHLARARRPLRSPRPQLPPGEQLLLEGGRHFAGHDLVREVLEDHGSAEGLRELMDDEVGRRTAQRKGGEPLADLVAGAQRLGLRRDDTPVHCLRQRHELHFSMQHDEREPPVSGGVDHDCRSGGVMRAELENQPGEPRIDELIHESAQLRRARSARPTRWTAAARRR